MWTLCLDNSLIAKTQFIVGNGEVYFEAVKGKSVEGIVLKRKVSRYKVGKRSHSWLKVVNYQYENVFVTGYRKSGDFGLLLMFDDGRYTGVMGLGVQPFDRRRFTITIDP